MKRIVVILTLIVALASLAAGQAKGKRPARRQAASADQAAKVRSMFVKPVQLAQVAQRHAEIRKYRLTIDHDEKKNDRMVLQCEVDNAGAADAEAIATTLRAICNLRGDVVLKRLGTLPNDGKVIEDLRKYE